MDMILKTSGKTKLSKYPVSITTKRRLINMNMILRTSEMTNLPKYPVSITI